MPAISREVRAKRSTSTLDKKLARFTAQGRGHDSAIDTAEFSGNVPERVWQRKVRKNNDVLKSCPEKDATPHRRRGLDDQIGTFLLKSNLIFSKEMRLRPPSTRRPTITRETTQQLTTTRPQNRRPPPPRSKPPRSFLESESEEAPGRASEFEVVADLGVGTFGRSVVARRKGTPKTVAVKILASSKLISDSLATLPSLVHPFLARTLWRLDTPSKMYLGTELYAVSLEELRKASDRKALNDQDALFYCTELVLGLAYLHSRGVAHGALKPSNILVDKRGHVAISDVLGVVNYRLTAAMVPYLAPERLQREHPHERSHSSDQIGGPRAASSSRSSRSVHYYSKSMTDLDHHSEAPGLAAADWWSLGVVSYELLAGVTPFYETEPRRHFANILHKDPDFHTPSFTAAFSSEKRLNNAAQTLAGLLVKDPAKRLGTTNPDDVKRDRWFIDVLWDDALRKLLTPPNTPHFLLYHSYASSESSSSSIVGDLDSLDGSSSPAAPR